MADPPGPNGNHLGLTVQTDGGARWLVDVGLGDGPAQPLPLVAGVHEQDGYRYELVRRPRPSRVAVRARRPRWLRRLRSRAGRASIPDFEAMHATLSTESGFVRLP